MANVYVFTADGFEEIEGLTVVDLMRRAYPQNTGGNGPAIQLQ